MRIKTVSIQNYRMLHNVKVDLEDDVTLIVGKNNSGKTSFFEVIKTLVSDEGKLSFEDFSKKSYGNFRNALSLYEEYEGTHDDEAKAELLKSCKQ